MVVVRGEDFEVLLSDEPVLDLYATGPYVVPDGEYEGVTPWLVRELGRKRLPAGDLGNFAEILVDTHPILRAGVPLGLAELADALVAAPGAGAIVAGSRRDLQIEVLRDHLRVPTKPRRDRAGFWVSPGGWSLPGTWVARVLPELAQERRYLPEVAAPVASALQRISPLAAPAVAYQQVFADAFDEVRRLLDAEAPLAEVAAAYHAAGEAMEFSGRLIEVGPSYETDVRRQLAEAQVALAEAAKRAEAYPIERDQSVAARLAGEGDENLAGWTAAVKRWLDDGARSGEIHGARRWLDAMSRLVAVQRRATAPPTAAPPLPATDEPALPIAWFQELLYGDILPNRTWRHGAFDPPPSPPAIPPAVFDPRDAPWRSDVGTAAGWPTWDAPTGPPGPYADPEDWPALPSSKDSSATAATLPPFSATTGSQLPAPWGLEDLDARAQAWALDSAENVAASVPVGADEAAAPTTDTETDTGFAAVDSDADLPDETPEIASADSDPGVGSADGDSGVGSADGASEATTSESSKSPVAGSYDGAEPTGFEEFDIRELAEREAERWNRVVGGTIYWHDDPTSLVDADLLTAPEIPAEEFEVLLTGADIFDSYAYGPSIVDTDWLGQTRSHLVENLADPAVKALPAVTHPWFAKPVSPLLADLPLFLDTMLGPGAVVGGPRRHIAAAICEPWLSRSHLTGDGRRWRAARGWWAFPGAFAFAAAGDDRAQRGNLITPQFTQLAVAGIGVPFLSPASGELLSLTECFQDEGMPVYYLPAGSGRDMFGFVWQAVARGRRFVTPAAAIGGTTPYVRNSVRRFVQATTRLLRAAGEEDEQALADVFYVHVLPYYWDEFSAAMKRGGKWREFCSLLPRLLADLPAESAREMLESLDRIRRQSCGSFDQIDVRIGTWLTAAVNAGKLHTCRLWIDALSRLTAALDAYCGKPAEQPRTGTARFHHQLMTTILPNRPWTGSAATTVDAQWREEPDSTASTTNEPHPLDTPPAPPESVWATVPGISEPAVPAPVSTPATTLPPEIRASLGRIVGQPDLVAAIESIHAEASAPVRLLVAGPPGTGRGLITTTIARILQKRGFPVAPRLLTDGMFAGTNTAYAVGTLSDTLDEVRGKRLLVLHQADDMFTRSETGRQLAAQLANTLTEAGNQIAVLAFAGVNGDRRIHEVDPVLAAQFRLARTRDFEMPEMLEICDTVAGERGARLSPEARQALERLLATGPAVGELRNGRLARYLTEQAVASARRRDRVSGQVTVTGDEVPARMPYDDAVDRGDLGDAVAALTAKVGLGTIKEEIAQLVAQTKAAGLRAKAGVNVSRPCPHMVFVGNPGTGKTMVARLLARAFHQLGALSSGRVTVVGREDFVDKGESDGTKTKTTALLERSRGGVLFVDDAHRLDPDEGYWGDPGRDAIATLLAMVDGLDDLVVILSGADEPMQRFLRKYSGLKESFPRVLAFPDYSDDELVTIFRAHAAESGLTLAEGVAESVRTALSRTGRGKGFANARLVGNLLDRALARQAERLVALPDPDVDTIRELRAADIPRTLVTRRGSGGDDSDPIAELEQLVGLKDIKEEVRRLVAQAKADDLYRGAGMAPALPTRHMVFTGNPGTAKTTIARLIARIYSRIGLISSGHLVEVGRSDLVGEYIGHTEPKVIAAVERALGGVLFIDEAYALASSSDRDFGHEAIATLVPLMEQHRGDLVVIAAGYDKEMKHFLEANSGLASRFPKHITFPDYSTEELVDIFTFHTEKSGFTLAGDLPARLRTLIETVPKGQLFGNGRMARTILEQAMAKHSTRITEATDPTAADIRTLTADDLPSASGIATATRRPAGF